MYHEYKERRERSFKNALVLFDFFLNLWYNNYRGERMAKKTLKCFKCKQDVLREELVAYASPNAQILHNYKYRKNKLHLWKIATI